MVCSLSMGRAEGDLLAALAARLRQAVARAHNAVEQSEFAAAASRLVGGAAMPRHCAWCGRLDLGRGWREPTNAPRFLAATLERGATHTICPDCVRRLEKSGQSKRADEVSAHCKEAGDPQPEDDDGEP